MRRSAQSAEKQFICPKVENETLMEPKTKKMRSNDKIKNIAVDNGTLMEVFKCLNYSQLAKSSLISTRFSDLIRTNRHYLALLYVDSIIMRRAMEPDGKRCIKMFDNELSREAYNEWIIRNQYSKQIPFEDQIAESKSIKQYKMYTLSAHADYQDPNYIRSYGRVSSIAFFARAHLNHDNWPLFHHFVRLLSDPLICIRFVELSPQNDVFNLLAGVINEDRNNLQCRKFSFNLEGNIQKFITLIKNNVCCNELHFYNDNGTKYDEELLDFFVTGARCTSTIIIRHYDLSNVVLNFLQKFTDLKSCDECQFVQSIENIQIECNRILRILNRNYSNYIVKEEEDENSNVTVHFKFINNNIKKKLQLNVRHHYLYHKSYLLLEIKNM